MFPAAAVCPHNAPRGPCNVAVAVVLSCFSPCHTCLPSSRKETCRPNQKTNRRENTKKDALPSRRAFDLFGHATSHAQPLRCCNASLAGRAHAREDVFLLLPPSPAARREGLPYLMTVCRSYLFRVACTLPANQSDQSTTDVSQKKKSMLVQGGWI